jgi:ferritin-like metal-binding protein YciE
MPKPSEAAHSGNRAAAFDNHATETQNHVSRLEQVFSLLVEEPKAVECSQLKGIAQEGEEIIDETEANTAQRNVGLIFAGQKAEHYEIATYGSLLQFAKDMGQTDIADLLLQTLTEGRVAKDKLPELATSGIN